MKYNVSGPEFKVGLELMMMGQFVFDLNSLYAHLAELTDQRQARGIRYQLAVGLTLITLAVRMGRRVWRSGWNCERGYWWQPWA